jgi:hypothetical protein
MLQRNVAAGGGSSKCNCFGLTMQSQSRSVRRQSPNKIGANLRRAEIPMPLFLIERNFAEDVLVDDASVGEIKAINDEIGIRWVYSFLSNDKRKTYCLYEAPNAEAIRAAAQRLGMPADVIIEVSQVQPEIYGAGR